MQSRFIREMTDIFGEVKIADIHFHGWEDIYWRLVRPGANDVTTWHADRWFWDCHKEANLPEDYKRLKIWVPIHTVQGLNELQIIPYSHRKEYDWIKEVRDGENKPKINQDIPDDEIYQPHFTQGQAVLFHEKLLHRGMPNKSDETRVSIEFILLVKDSPRLEFDW